ncbi:MAG: hypothetical protein ACQEXG_07640 [Pseudomonadota bacterium]
MSLHDLLRRRQVDAVPPFPCCPALDGAQKATENQSHNPCSLSSLENPKAENLHWEESAANDPESPRPDIDLLLANLRFDFTGASLKDIDDGLAGSVQLAILQMSLQERAALAALVVDWPIESQGCRQAMGVLRENVEVQEGDCRIDWIGWIQRKCPLVPDDVIFLNMGLGGIPGAERARKALRYVVIWHSAAKSEPEIIRKENAGRYAANRTLPPLKDERVEVMRSIRQRSRYGNGIANSTRYRW